MDQPRPFGGAPEPPPSPRPKEQENVPAVLVFLTALFLSLIAYKALQKPAPAPSEEPGAWAPPPARAPGEDDRMQVVAEKPALPASRPISPPDGLPRSAAARRRDELRRRRAEELTRARERFRKDGLRRLDGRSLLDAAPEEAPQQEAPPIAPERPAPPGGGGDAGAPSQPSDSVVRVQTPPAEETPKPAADKLGVESSAVAAPYPAGIAAAWESIRASGQDGARLYDYAQREHIPVEFGEVTPPRQGEYRVRWLKQGERFVSRDRAVIVIEDSLRDAGPEKLGLVLYHEYIHRLQDLSGQDLRQEPHTPEGMRRAVEYLRSQSQADPAAPLDVPGPVQASFGAR